MTPEQARQEQITLGRRMITAEGGPTREYAVRRPLAPRTAPKGHDAILKAMQEERQLVTITTTDGSMFRGFVTGRDKYTITLLTPHPENDKATIRRVFYKHAIEHFYGVQQVNESAAVQ
ncbi:RNA chaperone Hfq [Burkholderia vietnamiensis]|uniref:RNA chaperone Hfq n=1 Tax=Burkholderia vietnamiensis TaxID=60552 RepID=UPI001CB09443|nr:RNA chaperone Hfq [Burkholderia vietnamiensis]CAG9228988.1 hypothetical protein BVI1335_70132 [Burkholderia vietnamiensis]